MGCHKLCRLAVGIIFTHPPAHRGNPRPAAAPLDRGSMPATSPSRPTQRKSGRNHPPPSATFFPLLALSQLKVPRSVNPDGAVKSSEPRQGRGRRPGASTPKRVLRTMQRGVLGCAAEPLSAAETGEAEQGQPSKYASGRRPALHIWSTATRSSAPIFTRALRRPPGKLAKRKRNAVCFLQAGYVPRHKNRAPQPGGFRS